MKTLSIPSEPSELRVFHLVSNFRWTERAEPAADLLLGQRALGVDTTLVCGKSPLLPEDSIEVQAKIKGIDPLILGMHKHLNLRGMREDVRALRRLAAEKPVHVLHTHLPNAQMIATLAARKQERAPLVVHSVYEPEGPLTGFRSRWISAPRTDGWMVISDKARHKLVTGWGIPAGRVLTVTPPVDVERFQKPLPENPRGVFGIDPDHFVVGLVSRIGPDRGVDTLLKAVSLIAERCPRLRCLIVGRGNLEAAVHQPAAELGITGRVLLGGYCRWDKLVLAYRAMDVFSYIQPGTDKSCRAVREALAAGVPVAACRRGYVPELVEHGQSGFVCDPNPEALAAVLRRMYEQRDLLPAMASRAAASARERFHPVRQAEAVLSFYRALA